MTPEAHDRSEDDERPQAGGDNSLGRLLALSDGVFAIAMTLLALDLAVPELARHPSDAALRHALGENWRNYLSFVISFYVVAGYWLEHRRLMRAVETTHQRLRFDTIRLLFLIAALPFPAALLGNYGGTPFALAFYGVYNVLVVLSLIRLRHGILALGLTPVDPDRPADVAERWGDIAVFLLCVPAAYVLGDGGPFVLLGLAVNGRVQHLPPVEAYWARRLGR